MNKLIVTFTAICLTNLSTFAQSAKFFQIDYGYIREDYTDDQMDDTQLKAWVNADYTRIAYTKDEEYIEITDKRKHLTYLVGPQAKEYLVLSENIEDDNIDIPIDYIQGQEKTIFGYSCKLANITIDNGDNTESNIEIWYTTQIPNLFWADFSFLKMLPGAPLSITVSGNGFIAKNITSEELPISKFEIPADYTQIDTTATSSEEGSADGNEKTMVSDDRYTYSNDGENLYGLQDEQGNIILEPKYAHISEFGGEVSIVIDTAENYGAIDRDGNEVIPLKYGFLNVSVEGDKIQYFENGKFGLLHGNGELFIEANYDILSFPLGGIIQFATDDKSGFMNEKGEIIIPAQYDFVMEYNKDYFITLDGETYTLHSMRDNKNLAMGYEYLSLPVDGNIFVAKKNDKYGYIDSLGKIEIPFKYTYAMPFDNGSAIVSEDENYENYYYINTEGEKTGALTQN